jgi:hypothetical protein
MLRLPLSAVLLAVFLGGSSALGATSVALVASVVAFLVSVALDRRAGNGTDATAAVGSASPAAAPPGP